MSEKIENADKVDNVVTDIKIEKQNATKEQNPIEDALKVKSEVKPEVKPEVNPEIFNFKSMVEDYVQKANDFMLGLVSRTKDKNQAVFGYFDIVENTEPSLITDSHEVRYEFKSAQVKIVKGNQKIKVPISEDLLKLLYLNDEVENSDSIKSYKDLCDFVMNDIVKNVFRDLKVHREL